MKSKVNLFCIPFAGGNKYSYREVIEFTDERFNLLRLELPGRGTRVGERLLKNIHEITDDIFEQLKDQLIAPYAIYGHSLGALLSYLVTKKIIERNLNAPIHLFVSGGKSPSVRISNQEAIHVLPRKEFLKKLLEYGGFPK